MFKKQKLLYSWEHFDDDVKRICNYIKNRIDKPYIIYGVPKGGLPLATAVANHLGLRIIFNLDAFYGHISFFNNGKLIIVDDIVDSGNTMKCLPNQHTVKISLFLKDGAKTLPDFYCRKCKKKEWIVMPWEPKDKKMKRDKDDR